MKAENWRNTKYEMSNIMTPYIKVQYKQNMKDAHEKS